MNDILAKIIAVKKREVREKKQLVPVKMLEQPDHFSAPCVSLTDYLTRNGRKGVIAEIKRRSPSKGVINNHINVENLSIGYMQAGAAALSVLTDNTFFGGSVQDLKIARRFNYCPILRKEFIIDEYQIYESKSIGADAILLIEKILSQKQIRQFTRLAQQMGMQVLLEIDQQNCLFLQESTAVDVVGVNNRNLVDFSENLETSLKIAETLPPEMIKISESGIRSAEDAKRLAKAGFDGFLIGEYFMRER